MMALEFGDEKSEKPAPIKRSMTTMNATGVFSFRKQSIISPAVEMAMPMEASTPGL
jgi:hypothetical protein